MMKSTLTVTTALLLLTYLQACQTGTAEIDVPVIIDPIPTVEATPVPVVQKLKISGFVELHGRRVEGVALNLEGASAGSTVTDADGKFEFVDLPAGDYAVAAAHRPDLFDPQSLAVSLVSDDVADQRLEIIGSPYPEAEDIFGSDDSVASAVAVPISTFLQMRSIYPLGDVDMVKLNLVAGVEYHLFTSGPNPTSSGEELTLYAADGTTVLDENLGFNSINIGIRYIALVTGIHFLKIQAWQHPAEQITYFLGVVETVNADGDNYESFNDCDDSNPGIHPASALSSLDIVDNGVDEDCTGADRLSDTTQDSAEDDDSIASARPLDVSKFSADDKFLLGSYESIYQRTIHDSLDLDFFTVTIPAHTKYGLGIIGSYITRLNLDVTVLDDQGGVVFSRTNYVVGTNLENSGAAEKTLFIRVGAATPTRYVPYLADYGHDLDGDGTYTWDWAYEADCNDADANISWKSADAPGDGIDSDCDGIDG